MRTAGWMLAAGTMVLAANTAMSQSYPAKPIRLITGSVGGSTDFAARQIAQAISVTLGQQVVVENRSGGVFHGEIMAKSPPDGYTLLLHGSNIWLTPLLRANTPYDPERDLAPISLTNRAPNILVVHPSLPVKSVKDLVVLAKGRPGALNYSSGSIGSPSHLSAELFKSMAGLSIVRITFKSDAMETAALMSGEVQMSFGPPAALSPHIKSGRLKALAVTTAQPSPLFTSLPTVSASGLPGFEAGSINGMWAPAKTPAALISQLNQEIVRALNRADVREHFLNTGVEPVGSTAEQFGATIKSEISKWGKVIKDAGIREE